MKTDFRLYAPARKALSAILVPALRKAVRDAGVKGARVTLTLHLDGLAEVTYRVPDTTTWETMATGEHALHGVLAAYRSSNDLRTYTIDGPRNIAP